MCGAAYLGALAVLQDVFVRLLGGEESGAAPVQVLKHTGGIIRHRSESVFSADVMPRSNTDKNRTNRKRRSVSF